MKPAEQIRRSLRHPEAGFPQPRGNRVRLKAAQIQWVTPLRSPQAEPNSITGWAAAIKQTWARGSANTLDLARLISQAKDNLEHGEWSQLWRAGRLPFSKRKGEMLGRIGSDLGKLNAQNSARLPTAWNTLYYLALLGQGTVDQLVRKGKIHSGITLKLAKALLAEYHPRKALKDSRPAVINRLNRFTAFVRATLALWSQRERRLVKHELLALLEEISALPNRTPNNSASSEL